MTKGQMHAIRILVAQELGLNPIFISMAELYLQKKLHPLQYGNLESGGIDAVKKINEANKVDEALILAANYGLD